MGSSSSRSVEIQITNNTQNITLKYHSTFFGHGRFSKRPLPALFPRSSGTCHSSGDTQSGGVAGVLVYEAESFTLAIYFSNPIDYNQFFMKLGLELSPGKAHLGDLEATYSRMAEGIYSSSCQEIKFTCVTVGHNYGTAQLSHGPVKVMATMSYDTSSTLQVVLEEQKESGEEAEGEKPRHVKEDSSKRSETPRNFLRDPEGSPGSARTA